MINHPANPIMHHSTVAHVARCAHLAVKKANIGNVTRLPAIIQARTEPVLEASIFWISNSSPKPELEKEYDGDIATARNVKAM